MPDYKNMRFDLATYNEAVALQQRIRSEIGIKPSLSQIVDRGLLALNDNLDNRRWLSGPEAAVTLQRRHEEVTADLLRQVIKALRPDLNLDGVQIDREHGAIWLHFIGAEPISLPAGSITDVVSRD